MRRLTNKELEFHASPALYRDWCNRHNISLLTYPYAKKDRPNLHAPLQVYAVWDYGNVVVEGQKTTQLYVTYKAIRSKSQHLVHVYPSYVRTPLPFSKFDGSKE